MSYDSNTALNMNSTGSHITGPFTVNGNITGTNLTQTSITCPKSLVLSQTGDTNGSTYLTLQNRTGVNGIQILTTDPTTTLVDLVFVTGNASSRNFRMEGRAATAKTGANSFQFGNSDLTNPTISVGDAYAGITKLAVGSYTNPGTNALSVSGNTLISLSLQVNNGIIADQITPPLNGDLQLNGNNTNTKIVLGTGTTVITGTTVGITGTTSITGSLTSSGLITANAGLTVAGNVTMPGYTFASGLVSAAGAKITSTGQVNWSSSMASNGLYLITFTSAHPLGANYIVHVTSQGGTAAVRGSTYSPTSTTFGVHSLALGTGTPTALPFSFTVLA